MNRFPFLPGIARRLARVGLLLSAVLLAGCVGASGKASHADPDRARASLRQALDSWQRGETPDAFRERSSITASERKWKEGCRLIGYRMMGDGDMSGFDWQCKVQLSLQRHGGKKSQEKATYTISTVPALVIVRSEG